MRRILFVPFALLLLAVPTQGLLAEPSPAMSRTATEILGDAAQDAFVAAGEPQVKSIPQALESQAYLTALTFIAEATANQREAELWEAAQANPSPPDAFMNSVYAIGKEAYDSLDRNLTRLEAASTPLVGASQATRLAAAAELLVQGESDLILAGRFLGSQLRREDISYPSQRYTILLPAVKALLHAKAASVVLDGLTAEADSPLVNTQTLASLVQAKGGPGTHWQLGRHGPFHEMARHVRMYVATQPNATVEDLEGALGRVDASFKGSSDPAAAMLASARLDGAWWVARAEKEGTTPLWLPTLTFVSARNEGALYAQALLADSLEGTGFSWGVWALAGGAVVALVLVNLWRRGRQRGRSTSVLLVLALTLTLPLAPVGAHGEDASHTPSASASGSEAPMVPLPGEPTAFTRPLRGAHGSLALGADGVLHFTWVACETPATGCSDVYYRSFNPETDAWSQVQRVANPQENATLARIALAGNEVHVIWLQGNSTVKQLGHCLLRPFPCTDATRLNAPGQSAGSMDLVGDGERVFAVWSEERAEKPQVFGRWWRDGTWGDTLSLSDPTRLARFPRAALDEGVAHVVWQASYSPKDPTAYRVIDYATVGAAGVTDGPMTVGSPLVNYRMRPAIAVQEDGTVGIVFDAVRDVYLTERPPGQDWTAPVNVSRTSRMSQAWPTLNADGKDWVVSWVTGTISTFHMWQAHRENGFWLRPEITLGAPYDGILLIPQTVVSDGKLHVTWTSNSTNALLEFEMRYEAWPLDASSSAPPDVWNASPPEGAWVHGPTVQLRALVSTAAPLAEDGVYWSLDGKALPTTIDMDGTVRAEAQVTDGVHEALLRVEDRNGGKAERTIRLKVDGQAPAFTHRVLVDGQPANVSGWQSAPITIEASAVQDQASPAWVQLDYNGVGKWENLTAPAKVPEGSMWSVRLRAVDVAGNVRLGTPLALGWDATAPNVALGVPRWTNGALTPIAVTQGDTGSPVTVEVTVRKATGESMDATKQPLADLRLPVLPEGAYTVHAKAVDAVGHAQDVGTWEVGVDRQAPVVSVQGGLRLQDRGASGLANVTFLRTGEDASPVTLEGAEATLRADQLPGGGASVLELTVRDQAGNYWHGTANLASGEVVELNLDVHGETAPANRASSPAAVLLGLLLLGLVSLRRRTIIS